MFVGWDDSVFVLEYMSSSHYFDTLTLFIKCVCVYIYILLVDIILINEYKEKLNFY